MNIARIICDEDLRFGFCYHLCCLSLGDLDSEECGAGPFGDHWHACADVACHLNQRYKGERKQRKAMRRIIRQARIECPDLLDQTLAYMKKYGNTCSSII